MPLTIPDEAATLYAPQSAPDSTDMDAIVAAVGASGVISGCAVSAQAAPNMTVTVAAGTISSAGIPVGVAAVASLAIGAASPTDRRDLVVVSALGTVSVVAGTPGGAFNGATPSGSRDPVKPAIPAGSVLLAEIYVAAQDTTVASGNITDKRVLLGDTISVAGRRGVVTLTAADIGGGTFPGSYGISGTLSLANTNGIYWNMASGNQSYVKGSGTQLTLRGGTGGLVVRNTADTAWTFSVNDTGQVEAQGANAGVVHHDQLDNTKSFTSYTYSDTWGLWSSTAAARVFQISNGQASVYSNSTTALSALNVGRNSTNELNVGVASAGGQFFTDTVAGDGFIRVVDATKGLRLGVGNGQSMLGVGSGGLYGSNVERMLYGVRAGLNITGGGTVGLTTASHFGWSERFIVIAAGNSATSTTSGYFDIVQPTSGAVNVAGGATARNWNADGVLLNAWEALYYVLPIGSTNASLPGNYWVVSYTSGWAPPSSDWVLLALYNGEAGSQFLKTCLGDVMVPGTFHDRSARVLAGLTIGAQGNARFEIGRFDGVSSTPYIDFHSGATSIDYDTRLMASGGNGTNGAGDLNFYGAKLWVNGNFQVTSNVAPGLVVASDSSVSGHGPEIAFYDTKVGQATPNKFIRNNSGSLQIVNHAYTTTIFALNDAGQIDIGNALRIATSGTTHGIGVTFNGATPDNDNYGIVGVTAPASVNRAYYSMTAAGNSVYGMGMGTDNQMRIGGISGGKVMGTNVIRIDNVGNLFASAGSINDSSGRVYSPGNPPPGATVKAATPYIGWGQAGNQNFQGNASNGANWTQIGNQVTITCGPSGVIDLEFTFLGYCVTTGGTCLTYITAAQSTTDVANTWSSTTAGLGGGIAFYKGGASAGVPIFLHGKRTVTGLTPGTSYTYGLYGATDGLTAVYYSNSSFIPYPHNELSAKTY